MRESFETADPSAIRPAWEQVFWSNDPFSWPFRPRLVVGRVFYPTDGYHLSEQQFLAVQEALRQTGETGFLLSLVESNGLSFLDRNWGHWMCEHLSYRAYSQLPLTLENALYSREGRWGVLISHEMHALVAGSTEFMNALGWHYRGWSNDLHRLREAWSGNPNAGWVEPTLGHVVQAQPDASPRPTESSDST